MMNKFPEVQNQPILIRKEKTCKKVRWEIKVQGKANHVLLNCTKSPKNRQHQNC